MDVNAEQNDTFTKFFVCVHSLGIELIMTDPNIYVETKKQRNKTEKEANESNAKCCLY